MTLFEARNLHKSYSGRAVLQGLSFSVGAGEVVGLLGPNGAGKTTAFYISIGLIAADQGTLLFNDQDITSLPIHKRAKLGMGYLAQEPSVFRHLTVAQNILCILETLPLSSKERHDRLKTLLEELHLSHLQTKKASTLSGGERRRLEITRALVTSPSLLLLDEPFANVDPKTISDVKNMICHLKSKGISILITDHNAREIFSIADRTYLVRDGQLLQSGTSAELVSSEQVREAYLGHDFVL